MPSSRLALAAAVTLAIVLAPAGAQTVLRSFPLLNFFDRIVSLGDLDGDGVGEIGFMRINQSIPSGIGSLDIYSARTGSLHLQLSPSASLAFVDLFAVDDVNGDGRSDIGVWEWHFTPAGLSEHITLRSGINGVHLTQVPGSVGDSLAIGGGDCNGDGRADMVISNGSADLGPLYDVGEVRVIDGVTSQVIRTHYGTYNRQELLGVNFVGDIDGDGVRDYRV